MMLPILRRLRADFRRAYPMLARRLDVFELRAAFGAGQEWKVRVDYTCRVVEITLATHRASATEWERLQAGLACIAATAPRNLHRPLCQFVRGKGTKLHVEKLASNIAVAYLLQDRYGVSIREFDQEFFLAETYGMEFEERGSMSLREIRHMFIVRELAKRMDRSEPFSVYHDSRDHPAAVRQWVSEHLGERARWPPCGMLWSFLRVEDAVAFRLRWSGEQEEAT